MLIKGLKKSAERSADFFMKELCSKKLMKNI